MVSLQPSRRSAVPRRQLATLLSHALDDLAELERYARQLQVHPEAFTAADFSPRELDALIATVHAGQKAMCHHYPDLRPALEVRDGTTEFVSPELARQAPTRLIVAYKRCSCHLGLALQQCRDACDLPSADPLYRLLRNLEEQLWLLNAPPERPTPGFAMVGPFQAC